MRLFLDSCVHYRLKAELLDLGYEVTHCLDWSPAASDLCVVKHAFDRKLVLITHDKDFTALAHHGNRPFWAILRIKPAPVSNMAALCQSVITKYADKLETGHVLIATSSLARVMRPWLGP